MSGLIAKIASFRGRRLARLIRLSFGTPHSGCATWSRGWTMFGDITMTYFVPARWVALWTLSAGMLFAMLAKCAIA